MLVPRLQTQVPHHLLSFTHPHPKGVRKLFFRGWVFPHSSRTRHGDHCHPLKHTSKAKDSVVSYSYKAVVSNHFQNGPTQVQGGPALSHEMKAVLRISNTWCEYYQAQLSHSSICWNCLSFPTAYSARAPESSLSLVISMSDALHNRHPISSWGFQVLLSCQL